MTPTPILPGWTLALLIAIATFAGGYWAGDHNRNNACLARLVKQSRAADKLWRDEVARASAAEQQAAAKQQALQNSYANLEGKFNELIRRGPLVVHRTGAGCPAVAHGNDAVVALPAGPAHDGIADGAYGLSRAAIWMWNSALFGADTAAGTCSAADTASQTCATDSGLGLVDAWVNHAANAKSCAADRLRYQQLIDYLNSRPIT